MHWNHKDPIYSLLFYTLSIASISYLSVILVTWKLYLSEDWNQLNLMKIYLQWFITTFFVNYQGKRASINLFPLSAMKAYVTLWRPLWNTGLTNLIWVAFPHQRNMWMSSKIRCTRKHWYCSKINNARPSCDILEIESTLGISSTCVYKILHDELAVKKVCSHLTTRVKITNAGT